MNSLFGMQLMVNASENILIRSEEHIKKFILKLTLFCLHIKSPPRPQTKRKWVISHCLQKAYLVCFRNRTLTCKYRMYPGVRRGMRKNISAAALGPDQSFWPENQKGPVHTHTHTHQTDLSPLFRHLQTNKALGAYTTGHMSAWNPVYLFVKGQCVFVCSVKTGVFLEYRADI